MDLLDVSDAKKLVDDIMDKKNPGRALKACEVRDKWLEENDNKILGMSAEARLLLESNRGGS